MSSIWTSTRDLNLINLVCTIIYTFTFLGSDRGPVEPADQVVYDDPLIITYAISPAGQVISCSSKRQAAMLDWRTLEQMALYAAIYKQTQS